ncbi:MAG: LysR family transcriptional regulator [Sphingomonas sp.]
MTRAPFDLNLRHLRALPTIIARGSMSAAADAVSLSQPALTQGLAKLEAQLGVALFERRPDGVRPTPEGSALADRAAAAFAQLEAAARSTAPGGTRSFLRPEQLMTATQLRAFLAMVDAGSFVGAAAATGLSQPALHRAVRDLERICAVALVERRGRGVATTAAGNRLARGIRLAEREIELALAEIAAEGAPQADRVVVGAMPLSRAELIPRAVARLVKAMPQASVDIVDGSWNELVEPLRDGVLDLMIGALRPEPPPELRQTPLFTARLVVVARAGHPLAAEPRPSLAELARYPWIVGRARTPVRARWERLFAGMALPAAPIECGSVTTIRGMLRESDCLTLLSPDQFAFEAGAGLLRRIGELDADLSRVIGIIARADWRPGVVGRRFVALLEEVARELE